MLHNVSDSRIDKLILLWITAPEIEQGLADAAGSKVTISFTPHLIPMVRVAPIVLSVFLFHCLS
jgi:N-acetyl-gamma-glutamylphosphate reductase